MALDLETTGLTRTDTIISAAITGPGEHVAFFVPELLNELTNIASGTTLVFHNASFDLKMLAWAGVRLHDPYDYCDTLILSHLLDENGSHGLGDLVERYFQDGYKKEFWTKHKRAQDAPEDELAEYNARDVSYTLQLYRVLTEELSTSGIPESLVTHVHRLQRSLVETEIAGIAVDRDYLMQKGVELKTRIEGLLPKMRETVSAEIEVIECNQWCDEIEKRKTPKGQAGVKRPVFSFDSPKQLLQLLYEQLNLPPQLNEKTKNPSVDYDSLEKIKDQNPLVAMIQEYRELTKVYGTYIEGTLERMVDGRIYPSFNVTGTATGRISHSNPNMGNLPRDGGIRGMFVPDPGTVFISADFSQLEVCLSAHFTRDENLLRIVNDGVSQHDITASSLGIDRSIAKTVNFGMQYGCSHFKVAKVLGVSNEEGKKAYEKYWETYAGQKRVMDECARKVDAGTPIISPFGRRRRFDVCTRKPWDSAYRQSFNALIQGTGSDCASWSLYTVDAALRLRGWGRVLFSVHDELIAQVRQDVAEEAQELMINVMQTAGDSIGLSVPLRAQGSGGCIRWLD